MWKRENEGSPSPSSPSPAPPSSPPVAAPRRDPEPSMPRASEAGPSGRTAIGAGTVIHGEITGEEDLMVEGKVEGKIELRQNSVTVGAKGRVSAEVHARIVMIDGEVDGDVNAEEQIVIRRSGRVRGDLVAPRVTIEDGARFKGSIDMEPKRAATSAPTPAPRPAATPAKSDSISASLAAAVGSGNS